MRYFAFLLLVMTSCSKMEILSIEDQMAAIEECRNSRIESVSGIKSNLVGNWELVGYRCGFCANQDNAPVSTINFSEQSGEIYYSDSYIDTTFRFDWSIEDGTTILGEKTHVLVTDPQFYVLRFELFCEEFISFDQTPLDGPMFLFEKK